MIDDASQLASITKPTLTNYFNTVCGSLANSDTQIIITIRFMLHHIDNAPGFA